MKLPSPSSEDQKPWIPGVLPEHYRYKPGNKTNKPLSFTGFFLGMKNCPCCSWHKHILGVQDRSRDGEFGIYHAMDQQMKAYFDKYRELQKVPPAFAKRDMKYIPLKHPDLIKWREEGITWRDPATKLEMLIKIDDVLVDEQGEWHIIDNKSTYSPDEISLESDWKSSYKDQLAVYYHVLKANGHPMSKKSFIIFANARPKFQFAEEELPKYEEEHLLSLRHEIIEYEVDDSWIGPMLQKAAGVFSPHQNPQRTINCRSCDTRFAVRFSEVKSFLIQQIGEIETTPEVKKHLEEKLDEIICRADNELYGSCPFHELAAQLRQRSQMYLTQTMVRSMIHEAGYKYMLEQNGNAVINRRIRKTLPEIVDTEVELAGEKIPFMIQQVQTEVCNDLKVLLDSATVIDRIRKKLTTSPRFEELSKRSKSFAIQMVADRTTACVYKIKKSNPGVSDEIIQIQAMVELAGLTEKAFVLFEVQETVSKIRLPAEVRNRLASALPDMVEDSFEVAEWESSKPGRTANPNFKQRVMNRVRKFLDELCYTL